MGELAVGSGRKRVRCAIYTRKSTDEGLEQSFNSLDAQREACEAYILSQRHEAWECLPGRYDDGGYSGGTMDRPALKRLLSDIASGKVDVVVVYKIDRLSRSLSDFARIVEVLERAGASFVSVTQAFSTATSTGRLTLNMLLSFAQFERELGAERVRDKIAASKSKGMWMGGVCPIGYDVQNRALIVNQTEAATVRLIFDLYLQFGSVLALETELRNRRIHSKRRVSRAGKISGGKPFSRGALYLLLRNVLYIGRVPHRGNTYPGQHEAIVGEETFHRTQHLLNANAPPRSGTPKPVAYGPLLAGRLFDMHGRRLSPTHTTKDSRRYRYYVSKAETSAGTAVPLVRVPAGELESLVVARLHAFLDDRRAVHDAFGELGISARELDCGIERAGQFAQEIEGSSGACRARVVSELVSQVGVAEDEIRIDVALRWLLGSTGTNAGAPDDAIWRLTLPARLGRRTREVRLMLPPPRSRQRRDPRLIKLVVRAYEARRAFEAANGRSVAEVSQACGYEAGYFAVLVKLSYLCPSITSAILDGRQPEYLTRQRLARIRQLPCDWDEQRRLLQFEGDAVLSSAPFRSSFSETTTCERAAFAAPMI